MSALPKLAQVPHFMTSPTVTIYRFHQSALSPMPADKAALGHIPLSAFQYCEAMRTASSVGWYVFPPEKFSVIFDGKGLFHSEGENWVPLTHKPFEGEAAKVWIENAPEDITQYPPSFLRSFKEPGSFQMWSGFAVETTPGWSLLVRPLVNIHDSNLFYCYEGLVHTDEFRPMPLFINMKVAKTDVEVYFDDRFPIFQFMAIKKDDFFRPRVQEVNIVGSSGAFDWTGFRNTIRLPESVEPRKPVGRYGADARRRRKKGE